MCFDRRVSKQQLNLCCYYQIMFTILRTHVIIYFMFGTSGTRTCNLWHQSPSWNGKRTYPLDQIPIPKKNGSMEVVMCECHINTVMQYIYWVGIYFQNRGLKSTSIKEMPKIYISCSERAGLEPATFGTSRLAEMGNAHIHSTKSPFLKRMVQWR